jgi:hypothetical protein
MAAEAGGRAVVTPPEVPVGGAPDGGWVDEDFVSEEEGAPPELAWGPFLGAALRRRWWVWCLTAVAGLVLGLGFTVVVPSAPQGSVTVLAAHNPNENPADAI